MLTVFVLFVLTACSDSGAGGGSSGETDAAAVTAAQERLEPLLAPIETIEVDTPLTAKPGQKRVDFLRFNLPIVARYEAPMKEAAAALGWDLNIQVMDASDPQSVTNAMLRSVSENVDYIGVMAGDMGQMGAGLEAARDAGIPVFLAAGVGTPEGEANGLYGNVAVDNVQGGVVSLLDQAIVDSGGTGSILLVNGPDFPAFAPLADVGKKHVADNCSKCSFSHLGISAADIGGDVASTVVSAVRENPDIKYVVASLEDLAGGLPQALAAAGMDDVKVYVYGPSDATVERIERGDFDAGVVFNHDSLMWLLFDQIARVSVGMDPLQEDHANLQSQLWTTTTLQDGTADPSWKQYDYENQWKQLWLAS